MSNDKKHIDKLIQDFLDARLDKDALTNLYKKLNESDDFAEEVANKITNEYGRDELKNRLDSINYKVFKNQGKIYALIYKTAAIAIILVGLTFIIKYISTSGPETLNTQNQDSTKEYTKDTIMNKIKIAETDTSKIKKSKIFVKNEKEHKTKYLADNLVKTKTNEELSAIYFTLPELIITRGYTDMLVQAKEMYLRETYDSAAILFEVLLKTSTSNEDIFFNMFYSANSYLALAIEYDNIKSLNKAIQYLNFLIDDGNNKFVEQSRWYLALSYLKLGETEKCQELLQHIIQNNSYNSENAIILLENIKTK